MDFDWQKYHELAITWKNSPEEALKRCAISRAYYAFWHKLRIFKTIPSNKHQKHDVVLVALRTKYQDEQEIELSHLLKRLQDIREDADYISDIDIKNSLKDFFARLKSAEDAYAEILSNRP